MRPTDALTARGRCRGSDVCDFDHAEESQDTRFHSLSFYAVVETGPAKATMLTVREQNGQQRIISGRHAGMLANAPRLASIGVVYTVASMRV